MIFNRDAEERMKENILNDLNESESIYRFLSATRFFELLNQKELVLVKPKKWDDPFEDFLSYTIAKNKKGESINFNVTKDFYGQCWTLREECDGIWRNYASLDNGIRIESSVFKLLNAIYDRKNPVAAVSYFIGKVIYETDQNIKAKLSSWISDMLLDHSGKTLANFLLIKREEFIYEKEVRLLYSVNNSKIDDIIRLKIDPLKVIKSICFSPKYDEKIFSDRKNELMKYGFNDSQIFKSTLYSPYEIEIQCDDL